jgi:hypothetical protein
MELRSSIVDGVVNWNFRELAGLAAISGIVIRYYRLAWLMEDVK